MMAPVSPILLDMHLVGVKPVQRHARGVILLHQPLEERPRLRAEVVHFRRCVAHHHQDAIQRPDLRIALPSDRQAPGMGAGLSRFVHLDFRGRLQLHYVRRVDPIETGPTNPMLPKREDPHAGPVEFNGAFVVRPTTLFPQRDGKAAGCRVAVAFAVLHPAARLACLLLITAANLQRTQQAQLQPQPITLERLADLPQALDVAFGIRQQLPRFPALAFPVLGPELVEGEDDCPRALRLGPLADLAQGGQVGGAAHAQIHLFVRVLQILQLLVADQDDPGFGQRKLPRAGKSQGRPRKLG